MAALPVTTRGDIVGKSVTFAATYADLAAGGLLDTERDFGFAFFRALPGGAIPRFLQPNGNTNFDSYGLVFDFSRMSDFRPTEMTVTNQLFIAPMQNDIYGQPLPQALLRARRTERPRLRALGSARRPRHPVPVFTAGRSDACNSQRGVARATAARL